MDLSSHVFFTFNPNKAGLFEGSFFWEVSLTSPSCLKKNLSNINITFYNFYTIYLKYVESKKILTSSLIS